MFDLNGTNVTVVIWIVTDVLLLISVQYLSLRGKWLSKKIYPSVCSAIGVLIFIRLLVPIKLEYTHEIVYNGFFATLFRKIDEDLGAGETETFISIFNLTIVIWAVGAIINVGKDIYYYKLSMNYVGFKSKDITEQILSSDFLTEEQKQTVEKKKIRFLEMDYIASPQTFGLFRQIILLPCISDDVLSTEQWHFIILHELTHINRFDIQKKFVLFILKNVYWFIPLMNVYSNNSDYLFELFVDQKSSVGNKEKYMESVLAIMKKTAEDKKTDKMFKLNPVSLFSDKRQMMFRFRKMTEAQFQSRSISAIVLVISLLIFASSYLFSIYPDKDYAHIHEQESETGIMYPNKDNAIIIKHDDGTYTVMIYEMIVDKTNSLELYDDDIPMYDEKGNKIKWPFFHN